MKQKIKVFRTIKSLRKYLFARGGKSVGLVPTMGAFHEGHISLIKRSVRENGITVVTIFVNPTQFGPKEDYSKYPRKERADIGLAGKAGADVVFIPKASEMYPSGYRTYIDVHGLDKHLCGAERPGHFRGVVTVVAKLFNITTPDRAYFGKKDYQQQAVVRKMAIDLNMNTKIVSCPTIREKDGLALSSRNAYLTPGQRGNAYLIYKALKKTVFLIQYSHLTGIVKARGVFSNGIKSLRGARIEYFELVGVDDLKPLKVLKGRILAACAVRVGKTRLIDNIEINTQRKR